MNKFYLSLENKNEFEVLGLGAWATEDNIEMSYVKLKKIINMARKNIGGEFDEIVLPLLKTVEISGAKLKDPIQRRSIQASMI